MESKEDNENGRKPVNSIPKINKRKRFEKQRQTGKGTHTHTECKKELYVNVPFRINRIFSLGMRWTWNECILNAYYRHFFFDIAPTFCFVFTDFVLSVWNRHKVYISELKKQTLRAALLLLLTFIPFVWDCLSFFPHSTFAAILFYEMFIKKCFILWYSIKKSNNNNQRKVDLVNVFLDSNILDTQVFQLIDIRSRWRLNEHS